MKNTQAHVAETTCVDELKQLKRFSMRSLTHIKPHTPSDPFVQAAIRFVDFTQSMTTQGQWPGECPGRNNHDRFASVQTFLENQKVVEAVSFRWGRKARMRLRIRPEMSLDNRKGDLMIEFIIRDFAAAKAMADDIVAISQAAKTPKASHAPSHRL